jgi:hypothetical protein
MIRINLQTKKAEYFNYDLPKSSIQYFVYLIADLKNGDIAVGIRENLLILDSETMELKQILGKKGWDDLVSDILVFRDSNTG